MNSDNQLFVVGIGASAGGLDAVQHLFDNLPHNSGMVFVIIQHLSPDFKSLMPELLAKRTKMKIYTAKDQMELKPNCIYLNEPTKNLQVKDGKLVFLDKAPKGNLNLPIDIFFHTLGEEYKEFSYGVILSGTGTDGSRGIKTIKEAGGTIIVQDPASAQFDGMPNSSISTNLPDFILEPEKIADKIVQLHDKRIDLSSAAVQSNDHEKIYDAILELVQKSSGVNFKKYKTNTLLRRLEKRMTIFNTDSLEDYYEILKKDKKETRTIYQEFLIGVTSFFRDQEAYGILNTKVIPNLFKINKDNKNLRIWVAGCSTGEEVYSLAILIDNYITLHDLNADFKIFATDIDRRSIDVASTGIYSVNDIADIDSKFLDKYFVKGGNRIQIAKFIREKIVFSFHDVTKDPPFIRMDMISCRNLLIYLNNTTQNKVLGNFQYALNKSGFLFLGSSESLGPVAKYFDVIDSKWKIYQNNTENSRVGRDEDFDNEPSAGLQYLKEAFHSKLKDNAFNSIKDLTFYKYLSKKHSPTSVFIDPNYDILFTVGDLKPWLTLPEGQFQNNLLKITGIELSTIIRNGVRRVLKENQSVQYRNISIKTDDKTFVSDISFEKISNLAKGANTYLVEFIDVKEDEEVASIVLSDKDLPNLSKQRIDDLELELTRNRSELQNVVEELETSNEELQSSNEELMSSNEELQSSNEELQSVNEELYTVNTELQEKNKELENLNNDMTNLLNAGDVGTLFLDTKLNIRKFTPVIKEIFKLEDSDIGRSIVSFASEFDENKRKTIIASSKKSLEDLKSFEYEIQDNDNHWYLIKINPFITSKKVIDGVVLNFINLGPLKKVKADLMHTEQRLSTALESGNMAWWEMELPSGKVSFNVKKTDMLGRKASAFNHYQDFMKIVHPDDFEPSMNAMRAHLKGEAELYECQYRMQNIDGSYQWFQDIGQITFKEGENIKLAGIVQEITKAKEAESELRQSKVKAEAANIYKNQFLANMSHEIRTPMNGLVGFANLLRNPDLSVKAREKYIDIIENSSQQLLNLINDIIDISKIEAQELKIEKINCNLETLFGQLKTTFDQLKKERGKDHLKLSLKVPKKLKDLYIVTDPERLQQVMSNLIGNALKFTEEGTINFGYKLIDDKLQCFVQDTGIGIPEEKLEVIFERFQQVEKQEYVHQGTGLGLSISKGIITLLEGTLSVVSEVGKGSTFSFEIPYRKGQSNTELAEERYDYDDSIAMIEGKTVLIVEDEILNIEYLKSLFEGFPVTALYVDNGKDAIETIKNNESIDLVLMDLRMPLMNGYETAEEIIKIRPEIKIVAQSAYVMKNDVDKAMDSGFVDFMSKPFNQDELLDKMAKWMK